MNAPPANAAPARESSPRFLERLVWTIALGAAWIVVYAGCNWVSAQRDSVRVVQFAWEKHIPVIPWLIVPYMSIDLFFIASAFLCRTRRELHAHAARLIACTVIAGWFFLAVPMRLADERPTFTGFPGVLHDLLKAGDRPFNLFPSMHVALGLLLWPVFRRRLTRPWKWVLDLWFVLIIGSVLPVCQHHAIDVIGGALLAVVCFACFPDAPQPRFTPHATPERRRFARRYGLIGAAVAALGIPLGWWGMPLGWIGLSLLLVAAAYAFAGEQVFRKSDGRLAPVNRLALAPYLRALNATRRYYHAKAAVAPSVIADRLIVASWRDLHDNAIIESLAPTALLDLTAEHTYPFFNVPASGAAHLNIPAIDLLPPHPDQLRAAADFIAAHIARGPVVIFCGLGVRRSATAAAAYLLASGAAESVDEACRAVSEKRPIVRFTDSDRAVLAEFHISLSASPSAPATP